MPPYLHRGLFLAVAVATLHPAVAPGVALAAGVLLGVSVASPFPTRTRAASSWLLKASVVGLGFGLSFTAVLDVGGRGVAITAIGITGTLLLGAALTRLLRVEETVGTLVSGGTAICGGSAIAAIGPAIGATAPAMSVALATVFVLNGVALYIFPAVGHLLDLSQTQFALWSAIAIHDTSSVVGAAASYGERALAEATVLKLTRALWIVPVTLAAAAWTNRRGSAEDRAASERLRPKLPWFIALFVLASVVRTVAPGATEVFDVITWVARRTLVLTLFLIGASLTRSTLRAVGVRPLVLGTTLWVIVASISLVAIVALA